MSTRGVKFQFRTGESVLCFEPDSSKAKVLYDARVLDTSVTHDKTGQRQPAYLIHFLRWNSSWDRVVPESYLLKNTDDNRELMRKLALITQRECGNRRNKARSKKIEKALKRHFEKLSEPRQLGDKSASENDSTSEDDDADDTEVSDSIVDSDDDTQEDDGGVDTNKGSNGVSEKEESDDEEDDLPGEPVKLDLPRVLKETLERDCYLVKSKNCLLNLPASPNVASLLESYVKNYAISATVTTAERHGRMTRSVDNATSIETNLRLRKELVDGLRIIFDFTLPLVLLYDCERVQYESVIQHAVHEAPGSQHKLRLGDSPRCVSPSPQKSNTDRGRGRKQAEVASDEDELEVIFKSEPVPERSPRRHLSSPRESSARRRRSRASNEAGTAMTEAIVEVGRRRSGKPTRDTLLRQSMKESQMDCSMPPPLLKSAVGSATVSSRASSPERPLPTLTAITPNYPHAAGDILNWKLVPDELYYQTPAPPSLVYGAHHFLRLFVRLPEILNQMYIPRLKLSHIVRHVEILIQYLSEHNDDLFPESAYVTKPN